jgi:hypothetical protein
MASVITTSWGNELLALYFGPAKNLYIALFTADPGLGGSLANEVAGGSYARQVTTFTTPSSKTTSNNSILSFPNMPACTLTYLGICKTLSTTTLITYYSLPSAMVVPASAEVRWEVGDVALTF